MPKNATKLTAARASLRRKAIGGVRYQASHRLAVTSELRGLRLPIMAFFQHPPELANQYTSDRVLRSYLRRTLPAEVLRDVEPSLLEMGELSGGALFRLQAEDRLNEPRLSQWDAWGNRDDRIELTAVWRNARQVACERGVIATAYENAHGALSRVHQFALAYLFDGSTDVYTCPLAMTDGAARTLLAHQNRTLIERAVPPLTSRNAAEAWTSGQWMTERTGGSDVGLTETVARNEGGVWRLYGTKWFTSAITSEMALTLARPEGNGAGGQGLALFYLETRASNGRANGIFVNRLKDKLGTRKLPTAELTLDGAVALPVSGLEHGIRSIVPMLAVTRTWNAVCSVAAMRRGLALARDYARRRVQFGAPLSEKPLHLETFADLQTELEAAFQLAFFAVELLGREENGLASPDERKLLRLVTPLAKACTARQLIRVMPEVLEVFGGAGYVEDTGIPRLLRDAQVLPIWEGTTNVLSLDALRALADAETCRVLQQTLQQLAHTVKTPALVALGAHALEVARLAFTQLREAGERSRDSAEACARGIALTLARTLELALLLRHAEWSSNVEADSRATLAAQRFARIGINQLISRQELTEARALADDQPLV